MKNLSEYAGRAMDVLYKTAEKIASPVIDKVASVDFAGSYFNNPAIPEYMKFAAFRRNFISNENAMAEFPSKYPSGKIGWKEIAEIASVVGAAAGGVYLAKKYDVGTDDINAGISWAKHQIFGDGSPVVAPVVPAVNATVNPTITPQPNYDYYDKDFKVGIKIEGDQQFKQNVTNLLETMKEKAPNRYAEVIPYAPKSIRRSSDNTNYQGEDFIELSKNVESDGGSDNLKAKLAGAGVFYGELNGMRLDKTGERQKLLQGLSKCEALSKSEMLQNEGTVKFYVEAGLWTQQQADDFLKHISDKLKDGSYWNGSSAKPNFC